MALASIVTRGQAWNAHYVSTTMALCVLFVGGGGCSDRREPIGLSASDLAAVNEILATDPNHAFEREDFSVPHRATHLLWMSTAFHYRVCHVIGSSYSLRTMGDLSRWLRGKEKSEVVLRQFCQEPEFAFEGSRWTVTFYVIRGDGGVDEWTVVGGYDAQSKTNTIEKAEGRQVKPKGTFFYPLVG